VNAGIYTVTLTATDLDGGFITRTFSWTVVNVGPAAAPDIATTPEEQPVTVAVLTNDVDDDGDPLTVVAASVDPLQGSVVINANGTLTFTPATNFNGLAVVTYTIEDDGGLRSTASVSITVTPVNDAPVIAPLPSISTADGTAVSLNLSSFFSDVDPGQTLSVSYAGLPAGLTFDSSGAIGGTVARDASQGGSGGVYSVTATVTDGNGGSTQRTFTVIIANVAPVAADDRATTDEDTPVVVDLLKLTAAPGTPGKDVDPDGDALVISSATASNGTVTINPDGTVLYTPADIITYTVSDGEGGFSTASATITVVSVNDPPVARPDVAITNEDQSLTFAVLGNDTDPEHDTLSVVVASVPAAQGSVAINPDGTLTFTPAFDFNGTATITYQISDGNGGTATSTVTVTVVPQPEAPRPLPDGATTAEDTPVTINVLANDADPDGDTIRVTAATVNPAQGSVTINADGTITFTPAADFNGTAVITYDVTDDTGRVSTATATITVTPINDAPVALTDTGTVGSRGAITINPLGNDRDPDGPSLTITAVDGKPIAPGGSVTIAGGRVTLNPDGTLTFVPNPGYSGSLEFSYEISDGAGGFAAAMIQLSVTAEDDSALSPDGQPSFPSGPTDAIDGHDVATGIMGEGIILETVSTFGGLNDYTQSLAGERPLLTAVNGFGRLDSGLEINVTTGRIVDPEHFGPFPRGVMASRAGDDSSQPADPAILAQNLQAVGGRQASGTGRGFIDSRLDGQLLVLTFPDSDRNPGLGRGNGASGMKVTLADGSPLPPWLGWNGKGQLVGTPPEGLETIDILVRSETGEGTTVSRTLTINLRDGTASPLTIRKLGMDEMPPLFSRQLQLALGPGGTTSPSEVSLAELIRQAS
jgi:large repetitive protein